MAKVQFNCRLEEAVRDRIAELADGRSQADVITLGVAALDMQTAQGRTEATFTPATEAKIAAQVRPRKQSKKAAHVESLKSADIAAQILEREDIEYGEHTELPVGENVATLDVVGPKVSDGQGKVVMESWRSNRKPLLKPNERK